MLKKKSSQTKISSRLPVYIYTHMCSVHEHKNRYAEIQLIWILRAPQVSRPDPWAHIRVPHVHCLCVRVCVYTPILSHALPTSTKHREDVDNAPISPSVNNNPQYQATSALPWD